MSKRKRRFRVPKQSRRDRGIQSRNDRVRRDYFNSGGRVSRRRGGFR